LSIGSPYYQNNFASNYLLSQVSPNLLLIKFINIFCIFQEIWTPKELRKEPKCLKTGVSYATIYLIALWPGKNKNALPPFYIILRGNQKQINGIRF